VRIEFNPALSSTPKFSGVKFNTGIYRTTFGNVQPKDSFQITSVDRFFNENYIKGMISSNNELSSILSKNNISHRLNLKELDDLKNNHMKTTQDACIRIAENLPPALKANVNYRDLKEAAILHDFGKVLIPSEILNKNGALTPDEYKIMSLHSELGYQVLKNSGVNENVLNLIRNHHNNLDSNKKFVYDVDLQILNLADKYSALTEKRVYKNAMSPQQALTILAGEVQEGKVHPMLFNALVKAVNSNPFASLESVNYNTIIA
jgi:putative nucleotidyltransferase with HDIG domain